MWVRAKSSVGVDLTGDIRHDAFHLCSSGDELAAVYVKHLPQEVHVSPLKRCEAAGVLRGLTKPVCNE